MTIDFTKKTFGMISLGCDKNRVDSEKILSLIKKKGCTISDRLEECEIVIVNTCAFLNASRMESIDTILGCAAHKDNKLETIVVTGCLPQHYDKETFEGLTEADILLGIHDYESLFDVLTEHYQTKERIDYVGKGKELNTVDRVITTSSHYAYLKIADGCNNHCTYCLIPKIRGKYASEEMQTLVDEAESLGDLSELILVAQDITRYGEDLYGQVRLVELLQRLSALDNIARIRLLYAYPDMIDDRLIAEIRDNPKIVKYIDIPLQHSEDRILKLMNRKGKRTEYLALLEKLRREIPSIAIRSTFISGFPGETHREYERMKDFLKEARFTNCGFFAYSREEGTASDRLSGHLPERVKQRRVKRLYAAQKKISSRFLQQFVGQTIEVLCDGIDYDKNCFEGRTWFQAPDIDGKVYFRANRAVQGERYRVTIDRQDSYDLYGQTEDFQE